MDSQDSPQVVGQEMAEWGLGEKGVWSWVYFLLGHFFPLLSWKATDIITMSCFPLRFRPYPGRHLSSLRESVDLQHRSKGHDLAVLLSCVLSHVPTLCNPMECSLPGFSVLGFSKQQYSCCCSVAQSCLTLFDPLDCSTPGFPVPHHLLELAQTHVRCQWCHPAISSSVVPFSSCPQPFPASGSFLMSRLFAWGGQTIGVSASASVPPMNTQDWSPLGWTGWISFQSKGLSRVFSYPTVQKHQFFCTQPSLWFNSHIHAWPLEKPWLWVYGPLSAK